MEDTELYRQQLDEPLAEAESLLEKADEDIDEVQVDAASEALNRVVEIMEESRDVHGVYTSLVSQSAELEARLATIRDDTETRRVSFLPHGARLSKKFQECEVAVQEFARGTRRGLMIDTLESRSERARACIDQLNEYRLSTRAEFDTLVYYVPFGAVGLIVVVLLGGVFVRTNRRQALEFQLSTLRSEWAQRVPMLERRTGRMRRILAGLDPTEDLDESEIDLIDRAFVLSDLAADHLDRAARLEADATLMNLSPLEECMELFQTGSTQLTPENTAHATEIRDGLRDDETIEHADLLDAADLASTEALDRLDDIAST